MQEQLTTVQKLINMAIEYGVKYGFQVVGAIIVLILGNVAANWIAGLSYNAMMKKNMDVTLSKFLSGVVKIIVLGFAIIIALGNFGITIAPFVAALSAMAFGASFAVQGPLSNYGAGLSIILSRPFVVGNTITVAGVSGVVKEVKLACTILMNGEGEQITIPNKDIVGKIIENSFGYRLVDGHIGIGYENKPEEAVRLIEDILKSNADVSKNHSHHVGIHAFGDFAITIGYTYFASTGKYGPTVHAVNLAIFNALNKAQISIPFPHYEIKLQSPAGQIAGKI